MLQAILVTNGQSYSSRRWKLGGFLLLVVASAVCVIWLTNMPKESKTNCEACHHRPATRYDIYGGTGQVKALCATCFNRLKSREEQTALRRAGRALSVARCDYCGAPAVESSTYYSEIRDGGNHKTTSWCEQCRKDLMEFECRPENAIRDIDLGDDASLIEESRRLEDRKVRTEDFMRQRVAARNHE